jgi:glycosyltransferase involved in cell wall biosynthesis
MNGWELFIALSGILLCLGYLLCGIELAVGNRSLKRLDQLPPDAGPAPPSVSVIIPARNEESGIREALASVLALDYPDCEIIVVNDRSTDGTAAILAEMAARHPTLNIVTVEPLPEGWLGKNHAMFIGASKARGELLLFTDADIVHHPSTLRRAVGFLQANGLDNLSIMPYLHYRGWFLGCLYGTFGIFFMLFNRPWRAKNPKSRYFIGVGAFNLIKKSAYQAIGTHQRIALRPDDDMKLGKLVKLHGFHQDVLMPCTMLSVAWYPSPKAFINGLMKNTFAFLDFNVGFVLLALIAEFFFHLWPFIGLWFTQGWITGLYLLTILLLVAFYIDNTRFFKTPAVGALLFPLSALIFMYIVAASTTLTLLQHGIYWRDTFYPLHTLRANRL